MISDLGVQTIANITYQTVNTIQLNSSFVFQMVAPVVLGHTYVVLLSKPNFRGVFLLQVDSLNLPACGITYSVLSYEVLSFFLFFVNLIWNKRYDRFEMDFRLHNHQDFRRTLGV